MSILWFLYSLVVLGMTGVAIWATVVAPGLHAMPMYIADGFSVLSGVFLLVTSITEKNLGYAIIIHTLPAVASALLTFTEPESPPKPDPKNIHPKPVMSKTTLLILRAFGLFLPLLTLYWGFQRVEMEQAAAATVLGGRRRMSRRR
jgi:hypothetical protein